MGSGNIPGPNEINTNFYKSYWGIVDMELVATVQHFFISSHLGCALKIIFSLPLFLNQTRRVRLINLGQLFFAM